jgi:hypothetical protein
MSDRSVGGVVDASREELLEPVAPLVQDPKGRIARARRLSRHLGEAREQCPLVELRRGTPTQPEQATDPRLRVHRVWP